MDDIFLKILELADYKGDKGEWVKNAKAVINLNTFSSLVKSLPSEKQKEIEEKLKGNDGISKLPQVVSKYFNTEQIHVELEKQSEEFMKKYLESIFPQLPQEQQAAVEAFFNSQTQTA